MALIFKPEKHEYVSIDGDNIEWRSVTSFISNFKQPFDAKSVSYKSSKNKRSKWYGMTPEEIMDAWAAESKRATDLGTWYHNQREADICSFETIEREGESIPVFRPQEVDGVKKAPNQKLVDGIYPEHMVYLKSAALCGQSDLVEVINGKVNITDYKTNKEIKTSSYVNWEGVSQKMSPPLSHLDDCNLNHYAIQLSLYMFMILKHNPKLKPGKLTIHHIIFEEVDKDKWGNPIAARDTNGDPIVQDIVQYDLPYLKAEISELIKWRINSKNGIPLER